MYKFAVGDKVICPRGEALGVDVTYTSGCGEFEGTVTLCKTYEDGARAYHVMWPDEESYEGFLIHSELELEYADITKRKVEVCALDSIHIYGNSGGANFEVASHLSGYGFTTCSFCNVTLYCGITAPAEDHTCARCGDILGRIMKDQFNVKFNEEIPL